MDEPTKHCHNCKRDVAEKNFVTHSLHCQRYMEICAQCKEPIPKKEMDDHMEEFHGDISCDKCGESVERWTLESHEKICAKRLEACRYCELHVALDILEEHESFCGARSKACPNCREYVMKKDRENHISCMKGPKQKKNEDFDEGPETAEKEIKCGSCDLMFKASVFLSHQNLCSGLHHFMKFRQNKKSSTSSSDDDESNINVSPVKSRNTFSPQEQESDFDGIVEFNRQIRERKALIANTNVKKEQQECLNCKNSLVTDADMLCKCQKTAKTEKMKKNEDQFSDLNKSRNTIFFNTCDQNVLKNPVNVALKEVHMTQCIYCGDFFTPETGNSKASACGICMKRHTHTERNHAIENDKSSRTTNAISGSRKREHQSFSQNSGKEITANTISQVPLTNWKGLLSHLTSSREVNQADIFKPMCTSCNKRFQMSEIDEHMKLCASLEILCPICGKCFKVREIESHASKCADEQDKLSKTAQKYVSNLPIEEDKVNLSRNQKKKLAKRNKKEANKRAEEYLVTCGRSYSSVAKGEEMNIEKPSPVVDSIPCEFCEECFSLSQFILHQSACRPDLVHYPNKSENHDREVSFENEYAMASQSVRPKIKSTGGQKDWLKSKSDNKEAAFQNYANRSKECNLIEDEKNENYFSGSRVLQPDKNIDNFSMAEESKHHPIVINKQSKSISGSPVKDDDPARAALEYSRLIRGRGRARPTCNGPLPRPGEFLQRSQNVGEKPSQTCMNPTELAEEFSKVFLKERNTSSMLPYVFGQEAALSKRSKKSNLSSELMSNQNNSYRFEMPPEGSTVEEMIDNAPWKSNYSKNMFHENEEPKCNESLGATAKITSLNITSDDISASASDEDKSNISNVQKQHEEKNSSSSVNQNVKGISFKFTASASIKNLQKPYLSRTTRHLYQQSSKSKIEHKNNENNNKDVMENPDNSERSFIIPEFILFLIACISISFLLLLFCLHNRYILILLIAYLS